MSNLLSPEPWRKQPRKTEPPTRIPAVTAARATAKALLCVWSGGEHWVAKSQILPTSQVREVGDSGVLVIPAWLSRKMVEPPKESAPPAVAETITVVDGDGQVVIGFQADAELTCPVCQAATGVRLEYGSGDASEGVTIWFRCDVGGHRFGLRFLATGNGTGLTRADAEDGGAGNGDDTF
jgi:hypothetical protein